MWTGCCGNGLYEIDWHPQRCSGVTGIITLIAESALGLCTAAMGGAAGVGSMMLCGGTNRAILVGSSAWVGGRQN